MTSDQPGNPIDWANEPTLDPVLRAAIVWWHEHTGGSGFDDVYTIEEFLAHIRPLIEAPLRAEIEELSNAAEEAIKAMREHITVLGVEG